MLDILPSFGTPTALYNGKSLAERITGRFYTPDILAADLAAQMLAARKSFSMGSTIDLVDPFCGDGRLVAALLQKAAAEPWLAWAKWRIALWDRDAAAVSAASQRIAALASEVGLPVSIVTRVGDSFVASVTRKFDFVITNPPWELIKPDHREIAHLQPAARETYRLQLKQLSGRLDERFPDAKGAKAWGGWGTNLARCGWDLSMQLLKERGVLGIVLPSTLLADQSSEPLRRSAFANHQLVDIAAYPPEARLFDRVDQPVVSLTMTGGTRQNMAARLRVFDAYRRQKFDVEIGDREALVKRGYAISVGFGVSGAEILDSLRPHPKLADFEGSDGDKLWLGRELDETRISAKLANGNAYPFVKGRMVQRHAVVETPSQSVRCDLAGRFDSVRRPRVVWRDVSRASQRRRMIGTVIPKGWVAGNSLHVGCYRDGDTRRTQALHGILSSFVVEFQVRCRLATGHMSLGVVRDAHVPRLDKPMEARLAEEAMLLTAGKKAAGDRLEVLVAQAYGLQREGFAAMLESFEKIAGDEKARLLDKRLWRNA